MQCRSVTDEPLSGAAKSSGVINDVGSYRRVPKIHTVKALLLKLGALLGHCSGTVVAMCCQCSDEMALLPCRLKGCHSASDDSSQDAAAEDNI